MSLKRRNTSSPEPDQSGQDESPSPKRQRFSDEKEEENNSDHEFNHPVGREQPRSDPTYGQKGAFPGLDDDEDELFYGPPSDGLEYLRMVRSEAKGVPHLLVAPKPIQRIHEVVEGGNHDGSPNDSAGGYYADGAYTAAPISDIPIESSGTVAPDAQDLYYDSLSTRFNLLRATLRCAPPLSTVEALDSLHPISLPPDSRKAKQHWRYLLGATEPHIVQLACMDPDSVLEVVKLLTGMMKQTIRSREKERITRLGAWTWAVLGKCKDRTELGSEEIADLRELGKRAVGLLVGIRDRTGKAYGDEQPDVIEIQEDEVPTDEAVSDEEELQGKDHCASSDLIDEQPTAKLEEAKRRLQVALKSLDDCADGPAEAIRNQESEGGDFEISEAGRDVDKQIRTILDMIITVVGEMYGQRDLLEFRDIWTEDVEC